MPKKTYGVWGSQPQLLQTASQTPIFNIMKTANELPSFVLVDDDEDDRLFMREALRQTNNAYNVVEFENGIDFIDYLKQELEQKGGEKVLWLVIMDVNMPGMSGIEVLRIMREHPVWQQVPVIVLTAQEGPNQSSDLQAAGATDYVAKPSSVEELKRHIQTTFAPWLENPIVLR